MSDQPDPSWSAERMAKYLDEKYGKQLRFYNVRTKQSVTNEELVRLFDSKPPEPRK